MAWNGRWHAGNVSPNNVSKCNVDFNGMSMLESIMTRGSDLWKCGSELNFPVDFISVDMLEELIFLLM